MASTTSRVAAGRLRRAYSLRNQRPRADSMTVAQIASYSDSEGGAEGGATGERANGSVDMITHATSHTRHSDPLEPARSAKERNPFQGRCSAKTCGHLRRAGAAGIYLPPS